MKKIIVNNNLIEFDRIVAYGCSHTEASETQDHNIIGISSSDCDDLKRKTKMSDFYTKFIFNIVSPIELKEINRQNSYIKHLSDIFEVEHVNHAVGGSSLDYSSYLLSKHLYGTDSKDDNCIRKNDLIIIGITCPNRLFYFSEDDYCTDATHLQLTNVLFWEELFGKYFYEHCIDTIANDKTLAWKYFHQLNYLSMLSKENNNRIILVPMSHTAQQWMSIKDLEFSKSFNNRINEMSCLLPESFEPFVFHLFQDTNSRKKATKNEICGYGHAKTEEHIKFAKRLYKELTNGL